MCVFIQIYFIYVLIKIDYLFVLKFYCVSIYYWLDVSAYTIRHMYMFLLYKEWSWKWHKRFVHFVCWCTRKTKENWKYVHETHNEDAVNGITIYIYLYIWTCTVNVVIYKLTNRALDDVRLIWLMISTKCIVCCD
jgi:hypothetical protein